MQKSVSFISSSFFLAFSTLPTQQVFANPSMDAAFDFFNSVSVEEIFDMNHDFSSSDLKRQMQFFIYIIGLLSRKGSYGNKDLFSDMSLLKNFNLSFGRLCKAGKAAHDFIRNYVSNNREYMEDYGAFCKFLYSIHSKSDIPKILLKGIKPGDDVKDAVKYLTSTNLTPEEQKEKEAFFKHFSDIIGKAIQFAGNVYELEEDIKKTGSSRNLAGEGIDKKIKELLKDLLEYWDSAYFKVDWFQNMLSSNEGALFYATRIMRAIRRDFEYLQTAGNRSDALKNLNVRSMTVEEVFRDDSYKGWGKAYFVKLADCERDLVIFPSLLEPKAHGNDGIHARYALAFAGSNRKFKIGSSGVEASLEGAENVGRLPICFYWYLSRFLFSPYIRFSSNIGGNLEHLFSSKFSVELNESSLNYSSFKRGHALASSAGDVYDKEGFLRPQAVESKSAGNANVVSGNTSGFNNVSGSVFSSFSSNSVNSAFKPVNLNANV